MRLTLWASDCRMKNKTPAPRQMKETRSRNNSIVNKHILKLDDTRAEGVDSGPLDCQVVRRVGDDMDYLVEGVPVSGERRRIRIRRVDHGDGVLVVVPTRWFPNVQNLLRVLLLPTIQPMQSLRHPSRRVKLKVGHGKVENHGGDGKGERRGRPTQRSSTIGGLDEGE